MKTISIINLKGGVAKTVSAINIAAVLVKEHQKRVLLVDADKQANTSKFFDLHDEGKPSLSDLLTMRNTAREIIRPTSMPGLDVIPANMSLLVADKQVLLDVQNPQQTRLRDELEEVQEDYDFCMIDNAPDLNMTAVNALVASNDVMIPIKIDRFAFDGMPILVDQINRLKKSFNRDLRIAGCFVTIMERNKVNTQGIDVLDRRMIADLPMFKTVIRKTVKVSEMTFLGSALIEYAPRSTAAQDYVRLVNEYLEMC